MFSFFLFLSFSFFFASRIDANTTYSAAENFSDKRGLLLKLWRGNVG